MSPVHVNQWEYEEFNEWKTEKQIACEYDNLQFSLRLSAARESFFRVARDRGGVVLEATPDAFEFLLWQLNRYVNFVAPSFSGLWTTEQYDLKKARLCHESINLAIERHLGSAVSEIGSQKRRDASRETKNCHKRFVEKHYGGVCPCCHDTAVVEGEEVTGEIDHQWNRNIRSKQSTWLICKGCNRKKKRRGGRG